MFGKRKKEEGPISNQAFRAVVDSFSGVHAWYELKEYYEALYKTGGPTLHDADSQVDLNVTAKLLKDLHKPETFGEEREIFARALRRNARRVEDRGYRKEAERKRRLADRIMLPVPQE